ncbi:uncharacterized protein LOC127279868 [Leptopilina boulardi]|uniref:uncharacterized protein LOC127279868 n=1 Tax=Leptopilina boulardi TaxID=63433 RepID=UPI0021F5AEDC|nr:uncharacterized protein LOC127279868 [Leptopilina boulardi]
MKSQYGFQSNVFSGIKEKTKHMKSDELHGCLLIDEMQLTKSIHFNRTSLKMEGFTNLGDHTPEHQKGEAGDHALVIMFQPFKGKWIQTLGCFLSKRSATGTVLHKIIVEAIILNMKMQDFTLMWLRQIKRPGTVICGSSLE